MEFYKTGFNKLDELLNGGFYAGSLTVIGARPAMGKTSLMMDIASNLECPWIYYSLSDNEEILTKKLRSRKDENNIIIDKIFNFNELIENIINKARLHNVIFIDYLQLLTSSTNIYEDCFFMVNSLKKLAMQENICIILASQLSRKVEERQGHRPMFTDFRDCGGIEECADRILFILRRSYYDPNDKPGMAEIIIAKNKWGKTGNANFIFYSGHFDELTTDKNIECKIDDPFEAFKPN